MDGVLANWGAQIPARVLQEISKEKESGQTSSYIKPSQDRSYAAVTDDRKGTVSLCVCAGGGVVVVVVLSITSISKVNAILTWIVMDIKF